MENVSKEHAMKFLVGYTGSRESKAALSLARDFAKIHGAAIVVMTSMEGGKGESPEDISKVAYELKEACKFIEEAGIACESQHLARGLSPGEDVVRFAEENRIDHVFVGIEKKSKTRKMLLGSTAQYIILKAPCPVTTAK
jgi:nucleotide-binding universal stress UspA family protein